LVGVRRLWPDLLEAVKQKRRFTWIMLSQNAQVADVDDKTLTLALVSAGARESFLRSGSDEILRQAAIDVIGSDWSIDTIVDPSAQPGAQPDAAPRVIKPAVEPTPSPASGREEPRPTEPRSDPASSVAQTPEQPESAARQPVDPTSIANARGAIAPTRAGGASTVKPPTPSDRDAHRDDPDAEDELAGARLLERELGARIIEEIKHN